MVDIFCYRKYGHNEGDDPSFTHPLMYRIIEKKKSQPVMYAEKCRAAGILTAADEQTMRGEFRAALKEALRVSRGSAARRTRRASHERVELRRGRARPVAR